MVGGTAYAVGKRSQRGQQRESDQEARIAELEQQQSPPAYEAAPPPAAPPPPAAAAPQGDLVAQLQQLKELQDSGALSPEEFEAAKQKLLAGP
jgi:hypothetical protein